MAALLGILKQTFIEWRDDKVPRLAAALAYYALFSIGPLLVLVLAVAGLVFGPEAVQGRLSDQLTGLVGPDGAEMVESLVASAADPSKGIIAAIAGGVLLLFAAVSVLVQLQDALNTIWDVPDPKKRLLHKVKVRARSLALLLGVGFLLIVTLVVSAVLAAVGDRARGIIPGSEAAWFVLDLALSVAVLTVLFAALFRVLPDKRVRWRDLWIGSAVTAALFTAGKAAIGVYLGRSGVGSAYGAAGALVIILVWVYYCAQILLLGAEFTQVIATRKEERRETRRLGDRRRTPAGEPEPTGQAVRPSRDVGRPSAATMEPASGPPVSRAP